MNKILVLFFLVCPIFVFLGLMGAFFLEDILFFVEGCKTSISAINIDPDVQILLYLGVIGLVGIFRIKSHKK